MLVTVVGAVICVAPSYLIVIGREAANPVPVTVTDVPTKPLTGLGVIAGVTVKVAEAAFELASVAVTVLAPATDPVVESAGTVKEALKDPDTSVVTALGVVDMAEPAYVMVTVEEASVKPVPDTLTG